MRRKGKGVDELLDKYPGLKGFYWANEIIGDIYRQEGKEEASGYWVTSSSILD